MIRRPPRSTLSSSSAASDVYKRQIQPGALALEDLANQTGGHYLTFTGSETLPDPEAWLSSLRHIYQLSYTSKIKAAGRQSLSVQINAAGLTLTTQTANFELDIQPPNATLLSAPIQIVRQ